ncbi:MAG: hypothetical protein R3B07_36440 [Polyangiaceae bacterium]
MAIWPWYGGLVKNKAYNAAEFLSAHEYKHAALDRADRPAPRVRRGRVVNKSWGDEPGLAERHSKSDFEKL